MTRSLAVALAALLLCAAVPSVAFADSPQMIPVQGVLYDADGVPISGDLAVDYTLYGNAAGTVTLWTDTVRTTFSSGLFTTYLGEDSPINLAVFRDYSTVWVGVAIDGDTEIGRFAVATAPFAGFADYCGAAAVLADDAQAAIVEDAIASGDARYAPLNHPTPWGTLTDVPPGFADGVDNTVTEAEVDAFVANNGYQLTSDPIAWARLNGVPAGFADGVDNTVTEAEVDTFVANNGYQQATDPIAWSRLNGVPAGFADGVDNDTDTDSFASRTCPTGQVLVSIGASSWGCLTPGDITGIGVGPGLTGGGTDGDVTVGVNFGGTGSANTVARSDHTHPQPVVRYQVNGNAETTFTRNAGRYHLSLSAAYTYGTTRPIPQGVIDDYCGDPDGCAITLGMTRWDNDTQTAAAHRTTHFFYNTGNRFWRATNDAQGFDGSAGRQHIFTIYDMCYFTDGDYLARSDLGDLGIGLNLLVWDGYPNPNRTCELTIED
jgi:hypothetical protein